MIKVVLWDLDGTLLDFSAAERNSLRHCFAEFSLGDCSDAMIAQYSAINITWWQKLERGEYTKQEILVNRFREFFDLIGVDTALSAPFNALYEQNLAETAIPLPGVKDTLQALQGRVTQCIVSNGTTFVQNKRLTAAGLTGYFAQIFLSEKVGYEKPSPLFFQKVFDTLGNFMPNEYIIIGDTLTSDILGGINSGIHTCFFDPTGHYTDPNIIPEYTIADIPQSLSVIDKIS